MKTRGLAAIAAVLLLSGCAGSTQDQLSEACKQESVKSENRPDDVIVDSVESTVTYASDPTGESGIVKASGTTTVQADGAESTYKWTCFAQQSDGNNYAAIQTFIRQ